eukprot:scaffold274952_cov30-Tisochrysis_lutea.AAC.4
MSEKCRKIGLRRRHLVRREESGSPKVAGEVLTLPAVVQYTALFWCWPSTIARIPPPDGVR